MAAPQNVIFQGIDTVDIHINATYHVNNEQSETLKWNIHFRIILGTKIDERANWVQISNQFRTTSQTKLLLMEKFPLKTWQIC